MLLTQEEIKKNAGIYAADFIKSEMVIGLGTGTTVYWLIEELGKRVEDGLNLTVVATSDQTAQLAKNAGIIVSDLNAINRLTFTIDGADEIDPEGQLIKGGGGALLKEKIVASASDELLVIADSSKLVEKLGKFPLPVEVVSFGYKQVIEKIIQTGVCKKVTLRKKSNEIFITDLNHYILDCEFEKIDDAFSLNNLLHLIPGVVETGLFIKMATKAIIGYEDGRVEVISYK
jgi:ribose 5-phosphate isomerase A